MATDIRVFQLGETTGRLEIPQEADDEPTLYLFDPPMQQGDTYIPEKCLMLTGIEALQTLLIQLGNIPGITNSKE